MITKIAAPNLIGLGSGILCFLIWGSLPLFWNLFSSSGLSSVQIMAGRVFWSMVFITLIVAILGKFKSIFLVFKNRRNILFLFLSALILTINWLIYIWATTNGHIIEASLGYFINPLFNLFLGRFIFKEPLSPTKAFSILLVFLAVAWQIMIMGHIPWITLSLAISFGIYGVIRKMVDANTLDSTFIETLFMFPYAALYLLFDPNLAYSNFFPYPTQR
ncbi:EamA family transporter RarD [Neisseriaceae bacterium PsAf]|nr:EamA family transporter RarD [Neisseriaceae bacterium PsAf]